MHPSEDKIQAQIFQYYHNTFCLNEKCIIFSVPNGGHRNKAEAMKLKATGLLSGVSDLLINHFGAWHCVEVKEPLKGKQSPEQKRFERIIRGLNTSYDIVYSLDEFKALILKW